MRGHIYFVRLPGYKDVVNSCDQGYRPVVVVSSNAGNRTNNIAMVCPITTKVKRLSCNVDIEWNVNGKHSQVLCNQIITIPQAYLTTRVGRVSLAEQRRIDVAMCISLGINIDYNEVRSYEG